MKEINLRLFIYRFTKKFFDDGSSFRMFFFQYEMPANDKKRFGFNEDKTMIRANQGHSIEVDLNLKPSIPPDILYHGTSERFVDPILKKGLTKQQLSMYI